MRVSIAQSCLTLWTPWNSPGQDTGVGSRSLLQGIFPTFGSNPGIPHCRWILYQLNHHGSPLHCHRFIITFTQTMHTKQGKKWNTDTEGAERPRRTACGQARGCGTLPKGRGVLDAVSAQDSHHVTVSCVNVHTTLCCVREGHEHPHMQVCTR